MREKELIVYRNFEEGELLYDMAWLMENYKTGAQGMTELLYDCIHRLLDLAGNYGFHGSTRF